MIEFMLKHDFMINKSVCGTFVLTTAIFSGSGQMLLNTLKFLLIFLKFKRIQEEIRNRG